MFRPFLTLEAFSVIHRFLFFKKENCFSHKKEVGETLKLKQKQFSVTPSLTYALFARHFVQCNSFALVIHTPRIERWKACLRCVLCMHSLSANHSCTSIRLKFIQRKIIEIVARVREHEMRKRDIRDALPTSRSLTPAPQKNIQITFNVR